MCTAWVTGQCGQLGWWVGARGRLGSGRTLARPTEADECGLVVRVGGKGRVAARFETAQIGTNWPPEAAA